MAKERFVLRYGGEGAKPDTDVALVHGLPEAVVVDSTSRMLLVEADPGPLRQLVDTLPDWVMGPEQSYPVPDTRQRIERPPA